MLADVGTTAGCDIVGAFSHEQRLVSRSKQSCTSFDMGESSKYKFRRSFRDSELTRSLPDVGEHCHFIDDDPTKDGGIREIAV